MINPFDPAQVVKEYLKHVKPSKYPSFFIMPLSDYLEACGYSPEDAHWFGEEILDIMNNEWSPI